jgi:hypothetical protein
MASHSRRKLEGLARSLREVVVMVRNRRTRPTRNLSVTLARHLEHDSSNLGPNLQTEPGWSLILTVNMCSGGIRGCQNCGAGIGAQAHLLDWSA